MKIVVPNSGASLVSQMVKNLISMQETQVWTLGQEDSLEKEMANHYSILAWRITWTEEPGGLPSMESQRVGHDWATNTHTHTHTHTQYLSHRVAVKSKWVSTYYALIPVFSKSKHWQMFSCSSYHCHQSSSSPSPSSSLPQAPSSYSPSASFLSGEDGD